MGETKWLKIEARIRGVLDGFYAQAFGSSVLLHDACDALDEISSILGEETGRGYSREDAERKYAEGR